jgi:monoamine oxidase
VPVRLVSPLPTICSLTKVCVQVKILEASDRVGGRLKRSPSNFADFPIDLGGKWIHTDPKILDEITWDSPYQGETFPYKPEEYVEWNGNGWTKERLEGNDFRFRDRTWFDYSMITLLLSW